MTSWMMTRTSWAFETPWKVPCSLRGWVMPHATGALNSMYSAKGLHQLINLGTGRLQSIDLECCDLYIQRTGQFVRSFINVSLWAWQKGRALCSGSSAQWKGRSLRFSLLVTPPSFINGPILITSWIWEIKWRTGNSTCFETQVCHDAEPSVSVHFFGSCLPSYRERVGIQW